MAAEVQEGLRLDRTESGLLVVSVADGGECLVTPDLIKRSKVLSTLYAACASGESARLDADLTAIQSWLDLASCDIQGTATGAGHDIRSQLQMIQVSHLSLPVYSCISTVLYRVDVDLATRRIACIPDDQGQPSAASATHHAAYLLVALPHRPSLTAKRSREWRGRMC